MKKFTLVPVGECFEYQGEQYSKTGPLTAISLMAFIMFYAPCFVSVVCIAREAGTWKWATFSVLFNTALAFLLAVGLYQSGSMMGF